MASEIVGTERDALILRILKALGESRPHADAAIWQKVWDDALQRFRANPNLESLVPGFIRPENPVRWKGGFWRDKSELEYVHTVHDWLAEHFADCEFIREFGCGTGYNLLALSRLTKRPGIGYDLSASAAKLVTEAGKHFGLTVRGEQFDMRSPSPIGGMESDVVLTFGAMEQIGNLAPFIDWLVAQRPRKVVHIEPIPELLDPDNLLDWLSLRFHEKRGYTTGLLPYLLEHPAIEVQHMQRSNFGSMMLESYARIVWRPR